jgi:hypothetical protein
MSFIDLNGMLILHIAAATSYQMLRKGDAQQRSSDKAFILKTFISVAFTSKLAEVISFLRWHLTDEICLFPLMAFPR